MSEQRFALMILVRGNEYWRWTVLQMFDSFEEAQKHAKKSTEIVPYPSDRYDTMIRMRGAAAEQRGALKTRLEVAPPGWRFVEIDHDCVVCVPLDAPEEEVEAFVRSKREERGT